MIRWRGWLVAHDQPHRFRLKLTMPTFGEDPTLRPGRGFAECAGVNHENFPIDICCAFGGLFAE